MNHSDAEVAALLDGLQPRPEPPADVRDRVLGAVEREWRQHKRRRWRLPLALAAALLLAVAVGLVLPVPNEPVVARLADTEGVWVDGRLYRRGGDELLLDAGSVVEADSDTRITTAGAEVRLRAGTRLVWSGPQAVKLEEGALYVHTTGGGLEVHTPLGVVSDIGTTFMVTLRDGTMEVALREGAASIETRHGSYVARSEGPRGDVVSVDGRRITRSTEPASAGRWQWIHAVHPGYPQRELVPLLQAIAGDLGLTLEFSRPEDRQAALASRLEGDISALGPHQALEVALGSAGFTGSTEPDGRLVVEFPSERD